MLDHDRLFKELLSTFFLDFLALFAPSLAREVESQSVEFLEKELYTDVVAGERHEVDLLVKLRRRGQDSFVLVHVESQAAAAAEFGRRMFRYFARIEARHGLPVYPVALFSYEHPRRREPSAYRVRLPGLDVLRFRFLAIQLNRLSWQVFLRHPNPVAAALMSRMRIRLGERPRVKLECLRMLATLRLDPARTRLISGFLDTYLRLTAGEQRLFASELESVPDEEKGNVMEIVTSWMEEGIQKGLAQGLEQGLEKGRQEGTARTLLRQLDRRCGPLPSALSARIGALPVDSLDRLAEELLGFSTLADLERWLANERR
jgi:predicted transposase YdaD